MSQASPSILPSLAIGIDLGGTNIKASLIDMVSGERRHSLSRPTLDGQWQGPLPCFALTIRDLIIELESRVGLGNLPIGLCAPGLVNPSGRCVDWMPGRMHGLEKLDWADFLQRDIRLLNDAHAALLGEVWVGSARGCRDVFMMTLGTGVGGAVLSGGRLLRGAIGRGGHLGHISVQADAPADEFNTPGSLESFLGNQSLLGRSLGRYPNTHALVSAAGTGDEIAGQLWKESVRYLAVGIASLINVLDPECVILGGGIAAGAGDQLMIPLRAYLEQMEWRPGGHAVNLVLASAGEWAGSYGCVAQFSSTVN